MNMLSGAEILLRSLKEENVEIVFGYPGGYILPVYDALYDSDLKHVLCRHEQGAAMAADGYARATGRVGVCMATSGPGATNLVTGIANSYMDSVPVVAITGQVPSDMLGKDAFQEADITGITIPITKHNYLVKDPSRLADVVKESFYVASSGRQGPVLIDISKDAQIGPASYKGYPKKVNLQGYRPTIEGHPKQVKEAARAILESRQPVIYAGGGVVSDGASDELIELIEMVQVPVAASLLGLGGFPAGHPLFLGMLGMHGTQCANYAINESDLLIVVGARFDDRATGKFDAFAPRARVVHIDIDPAEIGKNVRADIPIVGSVKHVLRQLLAELRPKKNHGAWLEKIHEWQTAYPLRYETEGRLKPQYVIEQLSDLTRGEAIITTDVGQHQMWTAQFYRFLHPRSLLTSGGLGAMGYGLPAAVGAQFGCPDRLVVNIAGDGSIQMNCQELATLTTYKLPVKVIILNNQFLGMVRQWQELFYRRRYSSVGLKNPDFVKMADAYGIPGERVDKKEGVRDALTRAIETPGPYLLEFEIDPRANVYPMIPAGCTIDEMVVG